ncbi:MAG: cellulase family glycosylhydrolase [Calditrichaceae bacterium]|nr:cellulase family glycosylhydrolase [Calditrichaceae bacterium]
MRSNIPLLFFSLFLLISSCADRYPGFRVTGRYLYDKCGEKVILRGVNKKIIWEDPDGIPSYREIAKTGANVVRIVWLTRGTADSLDMNITRCRENKMIPMIECHDATGKWDMLDSIVNYWTRPDIAAVIKKHEEYLLLNIANEAGDWRLPDSTFRKDYEKHINTIRAAGIKVPLFIDASDWGKRINTLQSEGPYLIEADPLRNIMFSIHMWWPKMWGHTDSSIVAEINESAEMGLPLIVGEFGNKWEEKTGGDIPYKLIIKQCRLNEIGWIAWEWGPNNYPQTFLDMTEEGTFDTLHGWGLEVAITDSFSIKNTSVRPKFMVDKIHD